MKDCTAIRAVVSALQEYESAHKKEIDRLENQIACLHRERSLIIKNLEAGNIELLKDYFEIK